MDLKEFIKLIKKDWNFIILFGLGFMASGIFLYYFLPIKYMATGSFLVQRSVSKPTLNDFSYEGYYASQTSVNYAQSFSALLQSYDVRSKSLSDMGLLVNEDTLRNSGKNIKVKKQSPQMISLTVSSLDKNFALTFWNILSNNAMEISKNLNTTSGDPSLSIVKVSAAPILFEEYRNVYLNALAGFLIGTVLGISISALRKYLS